MNAQAIVDGTDAVEAYRISGNLLLDIRDGRIIAIGDPVTGRSAPVGSNSVGHVVLVFDPGNEWAGMPTFTVNAAN